MGIDLFLVYFCFLTTSMALDLLPQFPGLTIFQGQGGAYHAWNQSFLSEAKLGAAKLVLHPDGFALPHYSNSNKIAFVIQGSGNIGILLPNSRKETVLGAKKGDAIVVPLGAVSWYYNTGKRSDLEIVFLGETSQSYTPALFDYFFLAGATGVLGGFSNDIISRTYDFTRNESDKLTKSQTGSYIVKLQKGQTLPEPSNYTSDKILSYNLETERPYLHVNRGGSITLATAENFPLLKKTGLSATLINLYAKSLLTPQYTADSSAQLIYIIRGSGCVQIVGLNGTNVLDAKVKEGQLLIVPKFFVVAKLADQGGLKFVSAVTSSEPKYVQLAGPTAIANLECPLVSQAGLNLDPEFSKYFISKLKNGTIIVPPNNWQS